MLLLSGAAQNTTGVGFDVRDGGNAFQTHKATFYVWGTFGAGGAVYIDVSPSNPSSGTFTQTDGNSVWFPLQTVGITSAQFIETDLRYWRVRARVAGGDGTTSINVQRV